MRKHCKLSGSILVALIAVLMVVSMAYAVFVSIDTDDDALDANWSSTTPSPYITDASSDTVAPGAGRTDLDVTQGFVATDGAAGTDYLNFRLDTVTGPSAPGLAGAEYMYVSIDCNNNGVFNEDNGAAGPTDVSVVYQPETDGVFYIVTATQVSFGAGVAADGEQPGGANNSNEWRVEKQVLAAAGCTNAVSGALGFVFGAAIDTGTGTAIEVDSTVPGVGWNSPTAVSLQQFEAAESNTAVWLIAGLVLVFGLTSGLYWRRRRAD